MDAGAVQTNYALNFSAQQPSNVIAQAAMSPAPIVAVTESGTAFTTASATVNIADADTDLEGSSTTSASTSSSQAGFGNLLFTNPETGDTLTASLALNPALTTPLSISITSSSFNVGQISQTIGFTPASPVTYGVSPITLSATGGASGNAVVFTVSSGPGSISGSTLTVTGAGTIVIVPTQAGNTDYAVAAPVMASIVVNQATLTLTAHNATKVYGTANPAFTGPVTGQPEWRHIHRELLDQRRRHPRR